MRNNLRELEKARQEARREIQQLHNRVSCILVPSALSFYGSQPLTLLSLANFCHRRNVTCLFPILPATEQIVVLGAE